MTLHAASGTGPELAIDFSDADWESLHNDDLIASKVVVGLMVSIFTMGLILYSIVLATVMH